VNGRARRRQQKGTIVKYAWMAGAAIIAVAFASGDGPGLMRSVLHGFGWGIGREVAHNVIRHALH